MKSTLNLLLLFIGMISNLNAFVVQQLRPVVQSTTTTQLYALLPEEEMSPAQKEIAAIQARWNVIRLMSQEEVDALDDTVDGEYKIAYKRYYERYQTDMTKMEEIATKLQTMLDPPRIMKKTNGQRKRDKWAKIQARTAARAAEAAALIKTK